MANTNLNFSPELYQYILANSLREPAVLSELRQVTSEMTGAQMQIAPEQGQLMAMLIKLIGAKKVLELGTFTGYSSTVMALALPVDGQLITCDVSQESVQIAAKYWRKAEVADKIESRLGPALDSLDDLLADEAELNSFDFVFIDADKRNYVHYYEKVLPLLRHGGLIAVDNIFMGGAVIEQKTGDSPAAVVHQLNQKLYADHRIDLSILPVADGLTLIRKR